jgi:hypothetical protein
VTPEVILGRFESGHKYLAAIRAVNHEPWRERYDAYLAGELELETAMTLVHPAWLPAGAARANIYGAPTFGTVAVGRCESARLWGYRCDIPTDGPMHRDHLFPRSLGGPTWALNRLVLCGIHNGIKGADVHPYPWEEGEPRWLKRLLSRCAEFIE